MKELSPEWYALNARQAEALRESEALAARAVIFREAAQVLIGRAKHLENQANISRVEAHRIMKALHPESAILREVDAE